MKIKINEQETYEFKLPETIDSATFIGLLNRLKALKPLFETELSYNEQSVTLKGKKKKEYAPQKTKGYTSFINSRFDEIATLFFSKNPEDKKKLEIVMKEGNIINRDRLSIMLSYLFKKLNRNKKDYLPK